MSNQFVSAKLTAEEEKVLQSLWRFDSPLVFHRSVTNTIYFSSVDKKKVVVRLTQGSLERAKLIQAELEWLDYLAKNKVQIARPERAANNELVVQISRDLIACVFQFADGKFLSIEQLASREIQVLWGEYLGNLHSLTKKFKPSTISRKHWHEDHIIELARKALDPKDSFFYSKFNDLCAQIKSFKADANSYGLCHADFHHGNFHFWQNSIIAFDFDDCCYHFFSYDLSIAQSSIEVALMTKKITMDRNEILENLLIGHQRFNQLDQVWLERIDLFDQYRTALIYHWAKAKIANGSFNDEAKKWFYDRLPIWKKRLERGS